MLFSECKKHILFVCTINYVIYEFIIFIFLEKGFSLLSFLLITLFSLVSFKLNLYLIFINLKLLLSNHYFNYCSARKRPIPYHHKTNPDGIGNGDGDDHVDNDASSCCSSCFSRASSPGTPMATTPMHHSRSPSAIAF